MRNLERIRRLRRPVAAIGIAAMVAACGSVQVTPPASVAILAPSAAAGSIGLGSDPSAAAGSEPPGVETPSAGASPSGPAVPIDLTLLDVLPPTVAGLPVTADTDPAGNDDPGLADTVDRLAQAIVVDPATDGFAVVTVAALLPGVFDEPNFRAWRDTFDEGVCLQAGRVGGHAETQIAGRTVYIGTCTGGVMTYHVWLAERNAIVSTWSPSSSPLGEQVVAALRP